MKKHPSFPIRLYRWFVSRQVLIVSSLYALTLFSVIVWLQLGDGLSDDEIHVAEKTALICLGVSFLIFTTVSILTTRRLVIPLGRLIEKTKRFRKMPFESEESEDIEFKADVPGEWVELERALNKLGRELRQKTIRLSRENRAAGSDVGYFRGGFGGES